MLASGELMSLSAKTMVLSGRGSTGQDRPAPPFGSIAW
jgi:hypothetical protein